MHSIFLSLHRFWSLLLLFVPNVHPVILHLCAQILHVSTEKTEQTAKCTPFYHSPQTTFSTMDTYTLLSFHLQNSLFEESLLQRSLLLKTKRTSPDHCLSSRGRVSRSLFHCSHQPKNGWHLKSHRRESTPIRWARTQDQQSQVYREGKRRRRCSERPMDISSIKPKSDLVSQSDDSQVEESSEDVTVSYCTPTQQRNSEFSSRRRNFESIFSTDDIVIPMSLFASVKVERLKYKNILTPSWRKADIFPLTKREVDEQEEGMVGLLYYKLSVGHKNGECQQLQGVVE
ncbi:hypothetical protein cypCar_00010392 [Cyprinus carpio]|nr:hypothetical protein cypCar_00010392 [Cyprinus carpio]